MAPSHDGLLARVAELEQANTELLRSNGELLEFASIAAHELRAPLQTISGFAELLATSPSADRLGPEDSGYLEGIERSTRRLGLLVEGLLAYARVGTTVRRREEVDCAVLLRDSCTALAGIIDATSAVITSDPLPIVIGDEAELSVVFQNVLSNAIKYRREGVAPRIHLSVHQLLQAWQLEVADNGVGIAADECTRVFRVFQSLHRPGAETGTGIGLAVSKRIIEGHGGSIWIEPNPLGGACVSFTLPSPVCWSPFL